MEYRVISRSEIGLLVQLDRTETIDRIHVLRDGELVLEGTYYDVPDWSRAQKERRIAALQALYDRGATCFGAFDDALLVGMAVLDHSPMVSDADRLELAGVWVSQAYRKRGVGKTLCRLVAQQARTLGATTLYVTATPSENTVRFYRALGYALADPVDPVAYEREPNDIHMALALSAE